MLGKFSFTPPPLNIPNNQKIVIIFGKNNDHLNFPCTYSTFRLTNINLNSDIYYCYLPYDIIGIHNEQMTG